VGKLVVVTGIPGVGKSTVVKGTLEKLKQEGIEYKVINYGDVMLKLMEERADVKDRDKMRELSVELNREVQREAAKLISEEAREGSILLDTHCTVKTPKGYLPGLPEWVLRGLNPERIILIEADSGEITGRREKDMSRQREEKMAGEMAEHQQINRAAAMAYAALTGATVKIIKNKEGKVKDAVMEMVNSLR
jgi:adenylate kinase